MNGSDDRSHDSLLREHHRLFWEGVGEYPAIAPATRDLVKQNNEIVQQRKEFRRGIWSVIFTVVGGIGVFMYQQWATSWQVEQEREEQLMQQADQIARQEEQLIAARDLLEQQEAIRQANIAAAVQAKRAADSADKSAAAQNRLINRQQQALPARSSREPTTKTYPSHDPDRDRRWRWPWESR